jgi:hypothetical protein
LTSQEYKEKYAEEIGDDYKTGIDYCSITAMIVGGDYTKEEVAKYIRLLFDFNYRLAWDGKYDNYKTYDEFKKFLLHVCLGWGPKERWDRQDTWDLLQ